MLGRFAVLIRQEDQDARAAHSVSVQEGPICEG
jgi:hypothetical protein